MRSIFPILLLYSSLGLCTHTPEIFVHASDLKAEAFHAFLDTSQGQSLKQAFLNKTRIQDLNAMTISEDSIELRAAIDHMNLLPWLPTEAEVLIGLLEKIPFRELSNSEKDQALALLFSHENLQQDHVGFFQALKKNKGSELSYYSDPEMEGLTNFLSGPDELLFIDGQKWTADKKISRLPHQWLLISNISYPVLSSGHLDQLMSSLAHRKPFSSFCQNNLILWKQLPWLTATNLGAKIDCLPEENISNIGFESKASLSNSKKHEHQALWITSLAVVSVAIVANSLHMKKFALHWPVFKF